jgi:hypothetical protein
MSLMEWMFGRSDDSRSTTPRSSVSQPFQASTQFVASQNSGPGGGPSRTDRKELIRVVLRETLTANGVPLQWVWADALTATSAGRPAGTHIRLLMKHWDPRLAHHGLGLQQDFEQRLVALDPLAPGWLMGISWQYALPDNGVCPPLPHPQAWQLAASGQFPGGARASLQRQFDAHDAAEAGAAPPGFAPTQPAPL